MYDGCEKPIIVDANGNFGVSLGVSYREPTPVVLHVRAPGYDPAISRGSKDARLRWWHSVAACFGRMIARSKVSMAP